MHFSKQNNFRILTVLKFIVQIHGTKYSKLKDTVLEIICQEDPSGFLISFGFPRETADVWLVWS